MISISTMATSCTVPLPEGFFPTERDVVIGKGKKFYFHAGNQWLRDVVACRIEEYSAAVTKSDKSNVISNVVDYICKEGRFVKIDATTGKWVYPEPLLCREKCSQTFRDHLAQSYRSSNVSKRNKRRQEQQGKAIFAMESSNSFLESFSAPPAKRMRLEPELFSMTVSEDPAAWFDWEMPIHDLEEECSTSCVAPMPFYRRNSLSIEDIINLIEDVQEDDAEEDAILAALHFNFSSSTPKNCSASSILLEEGAFQQRTAAAFAA